MFLKAIGQGVAASFTIAAVSAVGNGLSTYILNGQTLRSVIDSRFGGSQ